MKYTEKIKIEDKKEYRRAFGFSKPERSLKSMFSLDYSFVINLLLKGAFFFIVLFIIITTALNNSYSDRIHKDVEELETSRFGIVFGSGITEDGEATKVLNDRVITAVDLYKAGKIQTILISGESRYVNYSETKVMRDILIKNSVPEYAILEDGESGRTYDTCVRAKKVYKVNQAVLITQEYHLPRALYLCNSFGLESVGFAADKGLYDQLRIYYLRERFAFVKSVLDINYLRPYDYEDLIEN